VPLCPSSAQSIPDAIGWIESAVRLTTWRYHSSEETEFNPIYGFVQRIANGLLCLRLVQLKRHHGNPQESRADYTVLSASVAFADSPVFSSACVMRSLSSST